MQGVVTSPDDQVFEHLVRRQHAQSLEWGNVFSAPRGRGRSSVLQPVAKGWLFSGEVRYVRAEQTNQRQVFLTLSINPTRFAAYARRFNPDSVQALRAIEPHRLLQIDPDEQSALEAGALSDWDNYLPGDRWLSLVTQQWDELVALYVEAITRHIVTDFSRRSGAAYPMMERPQLILLPPTEQVPQLHHVEVHWEFPLDDARLSFAGLELALRAAAPNFEITEEYTLREGREASSKWLAINLRTGLSLKVYPKLSTRLRIEVTYNGRTRSVGDLVNPEFRFSEDLSFWQRLEHVRLDGARRLNHILAGLPNLARQEAANEMIELACAFAEITKRAKGDQDLIREVLTQLTIDGAIDARPRTSLLRVAKALAKAGVLEKVSLIERSSSQRYVLLEPLASTFHRFRDRLIHGGEG
ncbi:hypothetical protein FS320_05125 [Microvirga tunisiensis]|uniref:Uncharacterized protein n=2 Tax=Microvirga tunisiensis TaxID=2108360 RepID=A0A5N7MCZ1_9HYPH|nr:hypothetical protein [Microvirga tunisiensis]MPR24627.1 hypothetical protein [Microvirga tunisiensis]